MIFKVKDMHTDSLYIFESDDVKITTKQNKRDPNRGMIIITVNDLDNEGLKVLLDAHKDIRPIFFIETLMHRRSFSVTLYRDSIFKDPIVFRGLDAISFLYYILEDQVLYRISEVDATVYNWNYKGKQSKYMMAIRNIYVCPF